MAFPSLKIECFHEMSFKVFTEEIKLYACNRTDMKAAEEFISPTKNGRGLDKLEKKCCQNIDPGLNIDHMYKIDNLDEFSIWSKA